MRSQSAAKGAPAHPLLVPAIAASQFAPPFMISGVAVALPALGADLGAGATALSLVETLFLAAAVALLLPAGRLGDAADKATLYKLGMAAFALSSVAIGLVSSVWAILALRLLQGACSAAVQAAGAAIIADAVPPERRGRAYGITIGAVYAGLTLGPIFAGFLVELAGWRAVFIAGGVVVLLLLAPIHFMLPAAWRRPAPRAVHVPSTALISAAMLALVGGAATVREGAIGYGAMALGLALLAAFLFLQRRLAQPLLNVEVLARNRVLRNALLVQWLLYCNAFGTTFLLSLHMQSVLGHSPNTAGQVIAVGTLLMAAIAPGRDRERGRRHRARRRARRDPARRRLAPSLRRPRARRAGRGLRVLLLAEHDHGDERRAARSHRHRVGALRHRALARHGERHADRRRPRVAEPRPCAGGRRPRALRRDDAALVLDPRRADRRRARAQPRWGQTPISVPA
jgi:MFS family permease